MKRECYIVDVGRLNETVDIRSGCLCDSGLILTGGTGGEGE